MRAAASTPPSGDQHELRRDDHRVVVTEVGATLRHYSVGDIDVIDGFAEDEPSSAGRGEVLAPWPNRLDEGTYRFAGRSARAALDEPERRNAIHGLVRWLPWTVRAHTEASIDLGCVLHHQPAYPWRLDLRVRYELDGSGLVVSTTVRNDDGMPAPFGIGFHPYLDVGAPLDAATIVIPATRHLLADDRGLPTGEAEVDGTAFDLTEARTLGDLRLDTAYLALVSGRDGLARATVTAPGGGRSVTLWVDAWFRYLMVYTGDTLEPASRRRCSVAIEPMTCPPNALRSGTDIIVIEPGSVVGGRWGLTPSTRKEEAR